MKFLKYLFISLFLIGLLGCNDSETKKKIQTINNNKSRPFIIKWRIDNIDNNKITIPTIGDGYNYSIDWGDGKKDSNVIGDITHTYSKTGEYTVKILGDFPQIYFNNNDDSKKIIAVNQWGDIKWLSMHHAFDGCSNLEINASDTPDLSKVTDMSYMFAMVNTDSNLSDWDVSNVKNMSYMFMASSGKLDITKWDVSNVKEMSGMFAMIFDRFNQDISDWNVSNVEDMSSMFADTSFSFDMSKWNISNVKNMDGIFTNFLELSTHDYDKILKAWSKLNLSPNVTFDVGETCYTSKDSRSYIISNFGWIIKDGGACSLPSITLNGDENITIYLNQTYKELNATAFDNKDGDISSKIIITGDVDTSVVGKNVITYSVTNSEGIKVSRTRVVNVIKDIEAPILEFIGDRNITIYQNHDYNEFNITAKDNADGDLSSSISISKVDTSTLGEKEVIFTVTDSAGNIATTKGIVTVIKDTTPPIIRLNGNSKIKIYKYKKYIELNATAYDNADGEISSNTIINGTVDSSVIGKNIITYSVKDSAGNKAIAQRLVTVYIDSDKDGVSNTEEKTKGTDPFTAPPFKIDYSGVLHVGNTIVLEANLSDKIKDKNLTYNWSLVEKPDESKAFLGEENSTTPYMKFDKKGLYTVSLNLKDGETDLNEFRVDLEVLEFKLLSKNQIYHEAYSHNGYNQVETYTYDKNGLLKIFDKVFDSYNVDNISSKSVSRTKYFYNHFNQVIKELYLEESSFSDPEFNNYTSSNSNQSTLYFYNKENVLVRKVVESNSTEPKYIQDFGGAQIYINILISTKNTIDFNYDTNNNLVEELSEILVTKVTPAYTIYDDTNGEVMESFEESVERLSTKSKIIYTYDNYHNRLTEKYDMDNDGTYDKEITNEYINGLIVKRVEGNHVSTYIYDSKHRLYNKSIDYVYDKDNNLIKTIDNNSGIRIEYRWKEF